VSLTLHSHISNTEPDVGARLARDEASTSGIFFVPLTSPSRASLAPTGICFNQVARHCLLALVFLALSGCLVTFKDAIPAHDAAPPALLGTWTSKNAWGEPLELEISRIGEGRYKAVSYRKGDRKNRDEYSMTVTGHHGRWYLSAELPAKYGSHFVIGGFELIEDDQLVVYNLDLERFRQWVGQKALSGQPVATGQGEVLLIDSPLDQVFGYLDDPANSDVFLDAAHYQRVPQ